ncbi:MAG TPA: [Fe-Fe] hydrogenase large subunit C-terminal domain-containing protein [Phycisphaerae bacterium]|nr:[Fe-Fe] hydrogenase large subunit C-terminal domain-containing protein [Phycisphaerae bacterium]
MSVVSYKIKGGDFENDGAASRCVKEQLKKVGADPAVVRRAMVAAYEAEMNVVIHACQGELRASLHDGQLDVDVVDEGPGIPDIEVAMTPGFSTASAEARQLGFGAGMGLPNIKKNSDRFAIESTVGKGTRISFTIMLKPQALYGSGQHAVHVVAQNCNECLACIRVCPTQALRVFRGKPQILDYLCIDCAACIGACPTGALILDGMPAVTDQGADSAEVALRPSTDTVLIIPTPCLVQCGAGVTPEQVLSELAAMGFTDVRVTDPWEAALRASVVEYAALTPGQRVPAGAPVISPVCPAIVNLIETGFPLLIPNIAPFLSGMEAAHTNLDAKRPMSVVLCPCQRTALLSGGPTANSAVAKPQIIVPSTLRAAVMPRLQGHGELVEPRAPLAEAERSVLQVSGLRNVLKILEAVEDGLAGDVAVLELYACQGGCFGSPLLGVEASLAAYRWNRSRTRPQSRAEAVRRGRAYSPRRGLRLDADMTKAIAKLGKINKLTRGLPCSNCGICGAPTCAALAEDIILGRATREACLRQQQNADRRNTGTTGDQEKAT